MSFSCRAKTLKHEVSVNSPDLILSIIEPLTTAKEEVVPLRVAGRAVFSQYAVMPARGLHFGPVTAATSAKPKTLEVANLGEFEFTVKLFDYSISAAASGANVPAAPPGGGAKGAAAKGGKGGKDAAGAQAGLTIGQFTFEPAELVVPPGGRREISIGFK